MYVLPFSTKHVVETRGDPTFSLETTLKPAEADKIQNESSSLYDTLIKKPCNSFSESLQSGQPIEASSSDIVKKARSVERIV